jgi:hypothetical protein
MEQDTAQSMLEQCLNPKKKPDLCESSHARLSRWHAYVKHHSRGAASRRNAAVPASGGKSNHKTWLHRNLVEGSTIQKSIDKEHVQALRVRDRNRKMEPRLGETVGI